MIAPGFVLCGRMIGQTGVGRGSGSYRCRYGTNGRRGALGRIPAGFTASTWGRKNPCKFPVVYRERRFALTAGCACGGRIATLAKRTRGTHGAPSFVASPRTTQCVALRKSWR